MSLWSAREASGAATQTFVAKDVTADILPPPLYLIEMRLVLSQFQMPAHTLIPNWEHRGQTIVGEKIFSDRIFYKDIVRPILSVLGTSRDELKELGKADPSIAQLAAS